MIMNRLWRFSRNFGPRISFSFARISPSSIRGLKNSRISMIIKPSTQAEMCQQFFDACRLPRITRTEDNFENIDTDHPSNIIEVKSEDGRVALFILPKVISKWPSFYASKQKEASDKNLFFHCISGTHALRFNATVDLLRRGKQVVSTGVAGIGKSAELNAYLMEFLSNIGKSGWPREVWYRVDSKLFKFYLFNGNTVVEEEENRYLEEVCILRIIKK